MPRRLTQVGRERGRAGKEAPRAKGGREGGSFVAQVSNAYVWRVFLFVAEEKWYPLEPLNRTVRGEMRRGAQRLQSRPPPVARADVGVPTRGNKERQTRAQKRSLSPRQDFAT